jgi:hypothetical protein
VVRVEVACYYAPREGGEVRKGTGNGVFLREGVVFVIEVEEVGFGYKVHLDFQDL